MSRLIQITRTDGGVSTMTVYPPAHIGRSKAPDPTTVTDEDVERAIAKWAVGWKGAVSWKDILPENVPPRVFREAWVPGPQGPAVDMAKALDIHMDDIRKAREPEFAKADNELKVAEDKGDTAEIARIRAKRQKLRDIPQTFDLSGAKTPDELAALWPAELPR